MLGSSFKNIQKQFIIELIIIRNNDIYLSCTIRASKFQFSRYQNKVFVLNRFREPILKIGSKSHGKQDPPTRTTSNPLHLKPIVFLTPKNYRKAKNQTGSASDPLQKKLYGKYTLSIIHVCFNNTFEFENKYISLESALQVYF